MTEIKILEQLVRSKSYDFVTKKYISGGIQHREISEVIHPDPHSASIISAKEAIKDHVEKYGRPDRIVDFFTYVGRFQKDEDIYGVCVTNFDVGEHHRASNNWNGFSWFKRIRMDIYGRTSWLPTKDSLLSFTEGYLAICTGMGFVHPQQHHINPDDTQKLFFEDIQEVLDKLDFAVFQQDARLIKEGLKFLVTKHLYYDYRPMREHSCYQK